MKKKILKIVFMVSFLPYIIMVLISLYCAVFGFEVNEFFTGEYIRTDYGIDAFLAMFSFFVIVYGRWIPILPIIAIYQIIYIIIKCVKKKKWRKKYES